jgi:ATP-dependent DNA helicase RecG
MENLNKYLMTEATEYEFKAALEIKKPKSWLKTVSAFANGMGGSIYIGVDDDGKVVGVADIKTTINKISELIKERIEPALTSFIVEPLAVDGKQIIRLKIASGENTPYYYVGDGSRTAYYRLGNQSEQAPSNVLMELTLKGTKQSFDAIDFGKRFSDYSFTLFDATFRERTGTPIDKVKDYISFGMKSGENLTYAGALFADQHAVYQSRIFCTRWNGLTKTAKFEAKDDAEFEGSIIKILGEALSFIKVNSAVKWRKSGNGRVEYHDYPLNAYYEALVNALIHRSYTIKGSEIHIDMYDDRMEIVSPGGMADGRLIQEVPIDEVASVRRNPVLCDIMHRMQYMDRRGSGLNKIINAYPPDVKPVFKSTVQAFFVILKNLNYGKDANAVEDAIDNVVESVADNVVENRVTKLTKKEKSLLELLKADGTLTIAEMAARLDIDSRTLQRGLRKLRDNGIIERIGSDRSGEWRIIHTNNRKE